MYIFNPKRVFNHDFPARSIWRWFFQGSWFWWMHSTVMQNLSVELKNLTNGLMQKRRNSIAYALDLRLCCIKHDLIKKRRNYFANALRLRLFCIKSSTCWPAHVAPLWRGRTRMVFAEQFGPAAQAHLLLLVTGLVHVNSRRQVPWYRPMCQQVQEILTQ